MLAPVVTSGYGPARLDTAVYLWFGWIIRRTPRVPRRMPVRASYGQRMGIFNVFHILRDPCVTCKGAGGRLYGHVRELTQPELAKIPHGRTGPVRGPHGLFTISKPVRARELIMHTQRATYGEAKFVRRRPVSGHTIFVQNSLWTARTGPGIVMWLRHKTENRQMWPIHSHVGSSCEITKSKRFDENEQCLTWHKIHESADTINSLQLRSIHKEYRRWFPLSFRQVCCNTVTRIRLIYTYRSPVYLHGLTLIPAWISNHTSTPVRCSMKLLIYIPKIQRLHR